MTNGRIARTRVGISQRATYRMGSRTTLKTDYKKPNVYYFFWQIPEKRSRVSKSVTRGGRRILS